MGYSNKAILNKNNKVNNTGKHSIFIRITVDRKSKYLSTGERIKETYWTGKDNRWIKDSYPYAFELNSIIRKKLQLLQKFELKQKLFDNGVSLKSLTEYYHKKADPNVFNEYVFE